MWHFSRAISFAEGDIRRAVMQTKPLLSHAGDLASLLDAHQAAGRYVLLRDDALAALRISDEALKKAARRLAAKGRLVMPRRGFFVLVPLEYRSAGAPPPSWFIDDLMKFHGQPYYLGVLSAASLYGAAHQQPQEFQVVTTKPLRPARAGRGRIRFFTKRWFEATPVKRVKTETGSLVISTPEATALDLVRYARGAGHLGNVATVLAALAEKIDARRLVAAARADVELAHVQRLGYLLDHLGAQRLTAPLAKWLAGRRPRSALLRPGHPHKAAARDPRWLVIANQEIETDE